MDRAKVLQEIATVRSWIRVTELAPDNIPTRDALERMQRVEAELVAQIPPSMWLVTFDNGNTTRVWTREDIVGREALKLLACRRAYYKKEINIVDIVQEK